MNSFAANKEAISARLRKRIEGWQDKPLKTQFQQYGPLNMVLTALFPNDKFIVKPQALYRELLIVEEEYTDDDVLAAYNNQMDPTMDIDELEVLREKIHQRNVSTDSSGHLTAKHRWADRKGEKKKFPDFAITMYGDLQPRAPIEEHDGPHTVRADEHGDLTRVVIEVGSLGDEEEATSAYKQQVQEQLYFYLKALGKEGVRWQGKACGIAIIGTKYSVLKTQKINNQRHFNKTGHWNNDIYHDSFIQLLENMATV